MRNGSSARISATCSDGGRTFFQKVTDEPQAVGVNFRAGRLVLDLADSRQIGVPLTFFPTLLNATSHERKTWEYWPFGTAIEWPGLDLQLSVEDIVAGRREHIPPPGFRSRTLAEMKSEMGSKA